MKFLLTITVFILISLWVEEAYAKEKSSKKGKGKKKQYLCPSYVLHVLYSYIEKHCCSFIKARWFMKTQIHKPFHIRLCAHFFMGRKRQGEDIFRMWQFSVLKVQFYEILFVLWVYVIFTHYLQNEKKVLLFCATLIRHWNCMFGANISFQMHILLKLHRWTMILRSVWFILMYDTRKFVFQIRLYRIYIRKLEYFSKSISLNVRFLVKRI